MCNTCNDTTTLKQLNFQQRAKSKAITNALMVKFAELDSPLKEQYWDAWHCSKVIGQEGETLRGKYCQKRWCYVCNRIRTAKLIKGYGSQLADFKNPAFVTLTAPNVTKENLYTELQNYRDAFTRIRKNIEKSYGLKIKGIRTIEITYNSRTDTFHPHFHLVVEGIGTGSKIVELWLKQFNNANRAAQDVRPADQNSVIELFKYVTKIQAKGRKQLEAIDYIFQVVKGKRLVDAYGLTKVSEEIDPDQQTNCDWIEPITCAYTWNSKHLDWIRPDGLRLSGYAPDERTKSIIDNILRGNIDLSVPDELIKDVERLVTMKWNQGGTEVVQTEYERLESELFQKMIERDNPKPFIPDEKPKSKQLKLFL
jgi:plasmid rolling circle replication initiator protein Rep